MFTKSDQLGILRSVTVHLSHGQIITLPTTGIEIIPAPRADEIIQLVTATLVVKFPTAHEYTNLDGAFEIYFTDPTDSAKLTTEAEESLLSNNTPALRYAQLIPPENENNVYKNVDLAGQPVQIKIYNGSAGNLTGGAPANSMTVVAYFVVIPNAGI